MLKEFQLRIRPVVVPVRFVDVVVVYESTEHNHATMRLRCSCEHVGAIRECSIVRQRSWLTLTVGFDEVTCHVRNFGIDLVSDVRPPCVHSGV